MELGHAQVGMDRDRAVSYESQFESESAPREPSRLETEQPPQAASSFGPPTPRAPLRRGQA